MTSKRAELYKLADALIAEMERQGVLSIRSSDNRMVLALSQAPVQRPVAIETMDDPGDGYRPNLNNAAVR